MINRRNYKNICVLLALTTISCSDSEGWMSSIPLSNEKISFTASLQEGWSGGQGSGDKSRAVKPDFPGLAREQKVLTTDEAFSKPLYLHPIETVNKTLKNQGPTTRGIMNTNTVVDNFRVSANYIQNEGSKKEESFFQDREAKKEGSNNNWFVADNVKWPAAGTVSFYAYAPYNYNNVSSLQWKGDDKVTQNKTIHYEVPTKVEDQPDFIVAKSEGKSFSSSSANTPVDLQFSHALTAITFSVSDDMEKGVINSIKIEGVKGEGDYDLSDNKWDLSNSTATGSYTVSFAGDEGKVEGKRVLTGGANDNKVLMMIPQTLGAGAKVTINFTPTGKGVKEASFSLGGTTWAAGSHITYVLSTTKILNLNMGTITYPDGWNSVNTNADNQIKSSYTNGDAIGMYVVDKYNKVIEANLKFTYNGSQWAVEPGTEFKGSPQYNYFVYYPYQSEGLPGAPAKETEATEENVASAENFFANAIDTWKSSKLAADQNTLEKMNACDLQIAKASSLDEAGLNISFAMKHTMGLAVLNRESKSLDHFYKLKGYEDYTWSNGSVPTTANGTVSGLNLFSTTATQDIMVVAPNSTTTFTNTSTGKDEWTNKSVSITINEGNKVYSVEAKLKLQHYETTYTMAVGDIYYSDGAMTHQSEALASGKTPIGIVGYLGNDYWTEKGVSGKGGHALVMCLKTIGSTGKTSIGTGYAWYSSNTDAGRTKINNKDLLVNSYKQSYGSGYTDTNYLINKWGSNAAAAYQAKNYSTLSAPTNKCTGWFLPSAGQYYAVMTTLGALFSDDWTGIWDGNTSTHPKYGFFSNMTTVTKNINDKLKTVGDSNYTEFFGSVNTWAWTSSEFSSTDAVFIDSGVDDSKGSGSVRFGTGYSGKTGQRPVRPFLAF